MPDLGIGTFGPAFQGVTLVHSGQEVVGVDEELALIRWVQDWAGQRCPGDPQAAECAVAAGLTSLVGGASLAEACEVARAFLSSWVHHPSHRSKRPRRRLRLAS